MNIDPERGADMTLAYGIRNNLLFFIVSHSILIKIEAAGSSRDSLVEACRL